MKINTLLLTALLLRPLAALHAAEAANPPSQFVFKTVGERKLVADVSYPEHWRQGDKRSAIVFWAGGGFSTGETHQFRPQAEHFAKRGMVAIRAEYRGRIKDSVGVDECLKDAISARRWVRSYPSLRAEDLANAWAFVCSHRDEIERQVRDNEEARGGVALRK